MQTYTVRDLPSTQLISLDSWIVYIIDQVNKTDLIIEYLNTSTNFIVILDRQPVFLFSSIRLHHRRFSSFKNNIFWNKTIIHRKSVYSPHRFQFPEFENVELLSILNLE